MIGYVVLGLYLFGSLCFVAGSVLAILDKAGVI